MPPAVPWFPSRERLRNRELGGRGCRPVAFAAEISRRRCDAATLSGDKTFVHKWAGGINCLELDETERRYLLVGTVDAVIAVYDTEQPTVLDPVTGAARHGEERESLGRDVRGGTRATLSRVISSYTMKPSLHLSPSSVKK